MDQLTPKYEEMQCTLDYVPEPSRAILLDIGLSSAINSNNPIGSMDKQLTDFVKPRPV